MRKCKKPEQGFSLVEMMTSLAILSVLILGVMTVMSESTTQSVRAHLDNQRTESMIESTTAFENTLSNLVRVRDLSEASGIAAWDGVTSGTANFPTLNRCAESILNGGPTGVYGAPVTPGFTCGDDTESMSCSSIAQGQPVGLLEFDAETSTDPTAIAPNSADGCLKRVAGATTNIVAGAITETAGFRFRGCKKHFRLQWIRPTRNSNSGTDEIIGQPGRLELLEIISATQTRLVSRLEGVYKVYCGFTGADASFGSMAPKLSTFRIDAYTKTRNNLANRGAAGSLESWHPLSPSGSVTAALQLGRHATYTFQANLRNLTTMGVYFGTTETTQECVPGGTAPAGANADLCCSGYIHNGTCADPNDLACAIGGVMPVGQTCCSKRVSNGATGKCI